jgi:RNA polymerase sigma-70 factor (ECF subfamily)
MDNQLPVLPPGAGCQRRDSHATVVVQPDTLDDYDDRRLAEAFQQGDEEAFGRIVVAYYPYLLSQARRRLRSRGDAEDAVQEALLRAYLALGRFGGDYRLRAWLNRILANACTDLQARRAGESRLFDRVAARRDEMPAADEALADADFRAVVKNAIASLPETYRIAFVLRDVEERSYEEVAQTMAVTEPNARARVHRARSSLARALRKTGVVLGGFVISPRSMGWRWLMAASDSPGSRLRPSSKPAGTSVTGVSSTAVHSTAIPNTAQTTIGQLSQALAQAASSPVAQTLVAAGAEVGRTSLPVAGVLATLAAAGAAAVSSAVPSVGAAVPSPAWAAAPPASSVVAASSPPPSASASAGGSPSTEASGPAVATVVPPGAQTADTTSGAPDSPTQWTWVTDATSANNSGGNQPLQGVSSGAEQPSSPAATPANCDLGGSLPEGTSVPVEASPAVAEGTLPYAYFASDTLGVAGSSTSVNSTGQGVMTVAKSTGTLNTTYTACLGDTDSPLLVGDISNPLAPGAGEIQLVGGYVATEAASSSETDTLYRGEALVVDGPDPSSVPVEFVADVALEEPANVSMLRVAFFGVLPDLTAGPTVSTSGSPPASSSSTSTVVSATTSSSTPVDQISLTPSGAGMPSSSATAPAASTTATSPVSDGVANPQTFGAPAPEPEHVLALRPESWSVAVKSVSTFAEPAAPSSTTAATAAPAASH